MPRWLIVAIGVAIVALVAVSITTRTLHPTATTSPTTITPYAPAAIPVSTEAVTPPPIDTTDPVTPEPASSGGDGGDVYVPHVHIPHPHVYACVGHHIRVCS